MSKVSRRPTDTVTLAPLPDIPTGHLDPRMISRTSSALRPWTREQLASLIVADAIGLAVIGVGAFQAHGHKDTKTALAWLALSLLGLTVAGTAHALWLMRTRHVLSAGIALVTDQRRLATLVSQTAAAAASFAGGLVVVPGSLRLHRVDCALAAGRATVSLAEDESADPAFVPCEVCLP